LHILFVRTLQDTNVPKHLRMCNLKLHEQSFSDVSKYLIV